MNGGVRRCEEVVAGVDLHEATVAIPMSDRHVVVDAVDVGIHFFFFQAEDGIRDGTVTGVQTCALPILGFLSAIERGQMSASIGTLRKLARFYKTNILDFFDPSEANPHLVRPERRKVLEAEIGRASCRERV